MQIGMTNPAVKDIDENVLRAKIAPLKIKRGQRRSDALCRIACNRNHDEPELRGEAAAANSLHSERFKRANAMRFPQKKSMITKNLGMLLLAIYLILVGIMALVHVAIPVIVTGILALLAGILILIGK